MGAFHSFHEFAKLACRDLPQAIEDFQAVRRQHTNIDALLYRETTPIDLRLTRMTLRCVIDRGLGDLRDMVFRDEIKIFCSALRTKLENKISSSSPAEQVFLLKTNLELKKLIAVLGVKRYPRRRLPFRGPNTMASRGVFARNAESRDELQERLTPRFQEIMPSVFMYTNTATLEETLEFNKSVEMYRGDTDKVLLFDVFMPADDEGGAHIFRGILCPPQGPFPRRLMYINTWWLSETAYDTLQSSTTLTDALGLPPVRTMVLPNDLGVSPSQRAEMVAINPILESRLPIYRNLQGLDEECRGRGQCQHWSFMTAYVFLKEYAALIRDFRLDEDEEYPVEGEWKAMCVRVWRTLELAEPTPGFNALQREMQLLGGSCATC